MDNESKKLLTLAEKVAEADVTTLITGPTGSGKEVLAKVLHDLLLGIQDHLSVLAELFKKI